jgi:RNA polymerase sigma-70 factor (ECF subfamily)
MDRNRTVGHQSDEELAARAAAGSRAAFEELVARYTPRLFFFLRPRSDSNEDIEDLIQETFLRTFRSIDHYDAKWKFSTWLFTTAVRLSISRHRSKKSTPVRLDPEGQESPAPGPQETLAQKEEKEERKNIWNVARTLKPREYEALWLHYAEDMPVKDIARAMKKSQVGVRALLYRSRLKLGKKLKASAAVPRMTQAESAPLERKFSIL